MQCAKLLHVTNVGNFVQLLVNDAPGRQLLCNIQQRNEWGTAPCRGVPERPVEDAQFFYRINNAVCIPLFTIHCEHCSALTLHLRKALAYGLCHPYWVSSGCECHLMGSAAYMYNVLYG